MRSPRSSVRPAGYLRAAGAATKEHEVHEREVAAAAEVVAEADALIVAAGAGIGIDSGLPDFRGPEGFWRAYPPYERLGLSFTQMASPATFHRDPRLAWGFYGHRRALYRATVPHDGFEVLRRWLEQASTGGFVFTSNVDGQFQRAGVDEDALIECHGTLAYDQCLGVCGASPWEAGPDVDVDETTMRAVGELPSCPACGGLARPNILMFGDGGWHPGLHDAQEARLRDFLYDAQGERLAVVEVGAGTAVPTVRWFSESLVERADARLVRINPGEPQVPFGQLALAASARDALLAMAAHLEE
jgi:NAD-dependent SIR2 family protein deacetylase